MGLDNPIHLAFVLLLVLLVFGAKRLPEMGRSLGEGMRGFKESINPQTPSAPLTAISAATAVQPTLAPEAIVTPVHHQPNPELVPGATIEHAPATATPARAA
jgi:sec-independent protein translocase protein TatA